MKNPSIKPCSGLATKTVKKYLSAIESIHKICGHIGAYVPDTQQGNPFQHLDVVQSKNMILNIHKHDYLYHTNSALRMEIINDFVAIYRATMSKTYHPNPFVGYRDNIFMQLKMSLGLRMSEFLHVRLRHIEIPLESGTAIPMHDADGLPPYLNITFPASKSDKERLGIRMTLHRNYGMI